MKNRIILLVTGLSLVFTWLFYKKGVALNLFLFNAFVIIIYYTLGYLNYRSINFLIILSGTILTSFLILLNHTRLSIVMNMTSLFLLSGLLCYPKAKSLVNSARLSFNNILPSQKSFWIRLNHPDNKRIRFTMFLKWVKIIFIPVLIIILFIFLYKTSNPVFEKHFLTVYRFISETLRKIISLPLLLTFILGFFISNFLLFNNPAKKIIDFDTKSSSFLQRARKKSGKFKFSGLRTELKSGIFLLIILNMLILSENSIDIYWVWFNFEWDGEYLKQFVHEGTYLLILSILISIAITLYFFRGNLNFFVRSGILKLLSYLWLFQNVILAISVGIRNYRYIETFALAFRRIGVFFFLALVLFGIFTVIYKIRNRMSGFYLFKVNALAVYIVLVIMAVFNWDIIIARYNFKNYHQSFVHLDFLSRLSDNALPYTVKSMEELQIIDKVQKTMFHFEEKYMSPAEYHTKMMSRKQGFIKAWESKKIFEWHLAGQKAYKKL